MHPFAEKPPGPPAHQDSQDRCVAASKIKEEDKDFDLGISSHVGTALDWAAVVPLDNEDTPAVSVAAAFSGKSKKKKKVLFANHSGSGSSSTSGGQQLSLLKLQAELAMIQNCYATQKEELEGLWVLKEGKPF
jgi:hypothetical protein